VLNSCQFFVLAPKLGMQALITASNALVPHFQSIPLWHTSFRRQQSLEQLHWTGRKLTAIVVSKLWGQTSVPGSICARADVCGPSGIGKSAAILSLKQAPTAAHFVSEAAIVITCGMLKAA